MRDLQADAINFVAQKGWAPGNTLGLTSVAGLMEEFARLKLITAAQEAERRLHGFDTGDDGFGVEDAIRRLAR